MKNKSGNHFLFETELSWVKDKQGMLSAHDAEGVLYIETPPAFGGEGRPWTPEHLFLGSVSTCFMSTFLAFANKMRISIISLKCPAIGQVQLVEGYYQFTQIDLYPEICVDPLHESNAGLALEKTYKYCLITRSIAVPVFYHTDLKIPAF